MPRGYFQGPFEARMEHYTDKSGECWLWTGTQCKGYPWVWVSPSEGSRYAHAIAWELEHGESAKGRVVRHFVCDTPLCVRPSHLAIGTHADNVADKVNHGRAAKGGAHGQTHLCENDVLMIRELDGQISQKTIARRFGISQAAVSLIVNRKTWTHI